MVQLQLISTENRWAGEFSKMHGFSLGKLVRLSGILQTSIPISNIQACTFQPPICQNFVQCGQSSGVRFFPNLLLRNE